MMRARARTGPTAAASGRGATDDHPLRVLLISHDLGRGGSERQLLALSRGLVEHGIRVAFILIGDAGQDVHLGEAAGAAVTVLGIPRWRDGRFRFLAGALRGVFRHLRAARRGHFDVVDAWLYQGYWLAAATSRLAGIKVFIAGRRSMSDFKDRWPWPARAIDRVARDRPQLVVANSEAVRRDVIRREGVDPRRIVVIRNGVALPPLADANDRTDVRAGWGTGPGDFVIGCVANLKPRKGIEDLVRAFAALPPDRPSHLVLVGDGPLREAVVRLSDELGVAGRVHFHGSDREPTRLLAGMDLFVHPSESEGLPNAVLEAAAAGLAIVATDAGGTREIVTDGETGVLVSVGAIQEMTEAMASLRCDADRRARLGAAAREHVRDAYGMERFVDETAALYRRLAAGERPARGQSPASAPRGDLVAAGDAARDPTGATERARR